MEITAHTLQKPTSFTGLPNTALQKIMQLAGPASVVRLAATSRLIMRDCEAFGRLGDISEATQMADKHFRLALVRAAELQVNSADSTILEALEVHNGARAGSHLRTSDVELLSSKLLEIGQPDRLHRMLLALPDSDAKEDSAMRLADYQLHEPGAAAPKNAVASISALVGRSSVFSNTLSFVASLVQRGDAVLAQALLRGTDGHLQDKLRQYLTDFLLHFDELDLAFGTALEMQVGPRRSTAFNSVIEHHLALDDLQAAVVIVDNMHQSERQGRSDALWQMGSYCLGHHRFVLATFFASLIQDQTLQGDLLEDLVDVTLEAGNTVLASAAANYCLVPEKAQELRQRIGLHILVNSE